MALKRNKFIVCMLAVTICCLFGAYFSFRHAPAIFTDDIADITVRDANTIDVTGRRIPGGEGIWRYHIRTDHWEQIPAKKLWLGKYDDYLKRALPSWVALDKGSVTYRQATPEAHVDAAGEHDLYTLRIMQTRLIDGQQTVLGTIEHTPPYTNWAELPDGSGLWVKEEHPTTHADWVQVLIHRYSYQTHRWTIVYRCPWYCRREALYSNGNVSMIRRRGDWLLVFNNAEYVDSSFQHPLPAELWVNFSTGAGRLGEPSEGIDFTDFSPDGRYSIYDRKVLVAPDWPLGSGRVGCTYSLAHQVGTLPEDFACGGSYQWDTSCRYLTYDDTTNLPAESQIYATCTGWLEHHTSLRFTHPAPLDHLHLLDTTGKEISSILGAGIAVVGDKLLLSVTTQKNDRDTDHFYLMSWAGKHKREIFRLLPTQYHGR